MQFDKDTTYIDAFRAYKKLKLDPLPLPYRNGLPTKGCLIADWPTKAASGEFTEADFQKPCTIGLLTGGPRNLTDLDCDCPEAVKIANVILSENDPTMVYGHEGNPRSHYLYAADRSLPYEKIYDPIDKTFCIGEYRCVKANGERGFQSVVPPSLWYDPDTGKQEEIRFEDDSAQQPAQVEASKIHHQFRLIMASAILARHFPAEHSRHNAHLALAGVFVRKVIDEETATRIVTLAYRYSAGYNKDEQAAASAVRSVYESFRDDPKAHLFGYPKLIEIIDQRVVDAVLDLLGIARPEPATSNTEKSKGQRRRSPDAIDRMLTTQHLSKLPPPEVSYLIDPEIPKGGLIAVTGKPGEGKTWLAMQFCKIAAQQNGIPIIYLNRDNPQIVMNDRMTKLGGLPSNFLMWGQWNQDEDGNPCGPPDLDSPDLDEYIRSKGECVVVVDTLRTFASGDENDNSTMAEFFVPLRRWTGYGATVIVIHHQDKEGKHAYRGASSIEAALDVGLLVSASFAEGKIERMTVKAFKSRFGDDINVVYAMQNGVPVRQTATHYDKLLSLLRQYPGITKEKFTEIAISKEHGFKRTTVRSFFEHGLLAGQISHSNSSGLKVVEPQAA